MSDPSTRAFLTTRKFHNADQEPVPYDGSPLQWRVSAYVVIIKGDQLLLIKNTLEKLFDIVGGGIEFGESIEESLTREAMEEAGATIKLGRLLHAEVNWFYHRKGQYYQTLQLFYLAELTAELTQPTEKDIEKVFWVPLAESEKYPLPITVEKVIAMLKLEKK